MPMTFDFIESRLEVSPNASPQWHTSESHSDMPGLTSLSSDLSVLGEPSSAGSLPQTYVALPKTTKLEEELNPFEQSFSGIASPKKTVLPPVALIDSPSHGIPFCKDTANHAGWDSLRAGPLSPSMLLGPALNSDRKYQSHKHPLTRLSMPAKQTASMLAAPLSSTSSEMYHLPALQNQSSGYLPASSSLLSTCLKFDSATQSDYLDNSHSMRVSPTSSGSFATSVSTADEDHNQAQATDDQHTMRNSMERTNVPRGRTMRRKTQASKSHDDEEKRKNFLERNRQAALKCRQRKKQWLQELQAKVEYLTADNEQLQLQANALRDEAMNLKTILMGHKSCTLNPTHVHNTTSRSLSGGHVIMSGGLQEPPYGAVNTLPMSEQYSHHISQHNHSASFMSPNDALV